MSTKVYTAYKVRPHISKNQRRFWLWLRKTMERGEKEVKDKLVEVYKDFMTGVDRTREVAQT